MSVRWEGLDELYAALRKLPEDLRDDASTIIQDAADRAYTAIYQGYGRASGDLREHLKIEPPRLTPWGVSIRLVNTSRHAWLWDNGTEARHYTSRHGVLHATGRMWGKSNPPHTFVADARWSRKQMYEDLIGMLKAHGLEVTGSAYDAAT